MSIDLDAVNGRLGIKLEDELAYWFPPEGIAGAAGCYRRHYVRLAVGAELVLATLEAFPSWYQEL